MVLSSPIEYTESLLIFHGVLYIHVDSVHILFFLDMYCIDNANLRCPYNKMRCNYVPWHPEVHRTVLSMCSNCMYSLVDYIKLFLASKSFGFMPYDLQSLLIFILVK